MSYIGSKPANKPVVASDLDPTVITGQTALASSPADTDEFLISDAGVLKRLDASLVGKGKVLQVVTGTTSSVVTHSTSYADTGLTASITPAATSSKIFVLVTQPIFWNANGLSIKILRDSTSIFTPSIAYTYQDNNNVNHRSVYVTQYLDSPSSTSSVAYKTQCILHSSGTIQTQESSNTSIITLMEIAG